MPQLENIEAIEERLWKSADTLRANSNYASNEYFMPVMGLIFLRHAYSRFLMVREEIKKTLPSRGGVTRELTKEDFSGKGAIFLQEKSQFDYLVGLPKGTDMAQAVIDAMESIEADHESLKGQLPKQEYRELDDEILASLLRNLNPEELRNATGDIFGRIYEYFLTGFAGQKAHDGGEFFTPVSLVHFIAEIIEPRQGTILDPACGSGGMFVQSAHFVERQHQAPGKALTFYGMEKNPTTIRLAKMNLAVHGLEGNIEKAITYYNDPHQGLHGNADFVMANPPFNVDEVDAGKIKDETARLPFGLPGVNKDKKVSNGNYLWISYFYSYINKTGRAGFVMSSQASSAGGEEKAIREKLIKTGHVDVMVDISSNFFYTRTVPCQLWFFDKAKPADRQNKVLMLDARQVYRQVNRTIRDFAPEQSENLASIVWLYRGQTERFVALVNKHIQSSVDQAGRLDELVKGEGLFALLTKLQLAMDPWFTNDAPAGAETVRADYQTWKNAIVPTQAKIESLVSDALTIDTRDLSMPQCVATIEGRLHDLAESSRDAIAEIEHLVKTGTKLVEGALAQGADQSKTWDSKAIKSGRESLLKRLEEPKKLLVEALKEVRYFWKQAHWLSSRFPEAKLVDVPGLVKLADRTDLESNDWSLTPGRYVGVAPEEVDEEFDFEETMRGIKLELVGLSDEAQELTKKIMSNLEELGI